MRSGTLTEDGLISTSPTVAAPESRVNAPAGTQRMNIVIVGHVDHGKSTVIGRLLADTHSLPEGKLEQVRAQCELNSKPFEYAFLLDALKDEQAQGITIGLATFSDQQTMDLLAPTAEAVARSLTIDADAA